MSQMRETIHEYNRKWEEADVRIIDCKTCGFIHVDPLPIKEDILEFYKRKYFTEIKPFDYESITDSYIEKKVEQVKQVGSYISIYNRVGKLLPEASSETLRMLDIGCGNDLLATFFHLKGWESNVLEPNQDATKYLRRFGLNVYERFADEINEIGFKDLSFVNIQFVLEHIAEPITLLQNVHKAMAPGGIIRICVPNDFSDGQLAYQGYYKEKLHWVVQPDHINYFSFSSLSRLLNKCGFDEVYRTTNFPLEFLLLGGINYYANEDDRQKVGPFVQQFHQAFVQTGRWGKLSKLYESLAQLEMGRSVFMFAVKR